MNDFGGFWNYELRNAWKHRLWKIGGPISPIQFELLIELFIYLGVEI